MSSIIANGRFVGPTIFDEADDSDHHKDLIYDANDNIDRIDIYEDASLTIKLFEKQLNYVDGKLITIVLTRLSDSAVATKTLVYDVDGNLDNIIIS